MYKKQPNFVVPDFRLKEIKKFVEGGLQDFSISRLKSKLPWGVPVPDDPEHVQFVWFDALINYISAIGWPSNKTKFNKWWPVVQLAGKDNLRQQSAIWQAMLMSADLPTSKQIFIHGFITVDGQKISKSLGNVIDPYQLVSKYGTDAVRYYLLAKIHPYEDSDFTIKKFEGVYNSDLANGIGNLVARVAKLCETSRLSFGKDNQRKLSRKVQKLLDEYRFDLALKSIWSEIKKADVFINEKEVWGLKGKEKEKALTDLVNRIRQIATDLKSFLPETANEIEKQFKGPKIKSEKPLFPRLG